MAHALAVDPIVLAGLLRCLLRRSIPSLVRRTIKRIAMGGSHIQAPLGVEEGRGARNGEQTAAAARLRSSWSRGCGLAHLGLLRCRGGFYAADLINSIMK